jgi:glycosyltransferase involved in cell wall biosynthesis
MPNLIAWAGSSPPGGVDTWLVELRKSLRNSRYNLIIVSDKTIFAGQEKPDHIISSWDQLAGIITRSAPVVVMPNWRFPVFGICAKLKKNGLKVKCLGVCHSDSDKEYYEPLAWYESSIDLFIAVGSKCREELVSRMPRRKDDILYIPYGIAIPGIGPKEYALDPLKIVYFGRISQKQKRIFDLVKLAKLLDHNKVPFELDIIGNGPDASSLKARIAGLGRGHKISMIPVLPYSDMLKRAEKYDVFIQVSEYEGMGRSMIEAMARKVIPCVTKATGGAWPVIDDGRNGFTVEVGNMEAMASALEQISNMDPGTAKAIGEEAQKTVKERFDIVNITPKFIEALDTCMGNPDRQWEHDGFIMKRGLYPAYLPYGILPGLLLRSVFAVFPRNNVRDLLRRLKIIKDE